MARSLFAAAVTCAAMIASGCAPADPQTQGAAEAAEQAPLTPAGPASRIEPEAGDDIQTAASVVEVTSLANQGELSVKLFGTAGGDPAMNGLYTYVAFYLDPAEGWRVFKLGDFLAYRVLSDSPGRIDLEVRESVMNNATGEIGSQTRNVIVRWASEPAGGAPTSLSVTPAR